MQAPTAAIETAMTETGARPLGPAGLMALLAGGLILVGLGLAAVWQDAHNAAALEQAVAIQRLRTLVGDVVQSAQDAETGQRGFLLSDNPGYLKPFTAAATALPRQMAELSRLRPNDLRVGALHRAIDAKLAELQQTITLTQGGGKPAAIELVKTNVGAAYMAGIRSMTRSLVMDLDDAQAVQAGRIASNGRWAVAINVAGLITVVLLATLVGATLRRYLTVLQQARAATDAANASLASLNANLEATVQERTGDLLAANEEIQRFAYIVSHDLRAPLVNIMGFTSELQQAAGQLARYAASQADAPAELREIAQEDIPEALRFITSSTSKMDRLINAILKLSREGRRVLTAEALAMPALFGTIAETLQHQAEAKGATIVLGPVPDLVADRVAVEQVFGNLVDNALKYLKPNRPGLIRISGRIEAGLARFDVTDNGRGIAQRDYERVFELFRRAGDQSVPGEGIGLAHVRALLRRLGGSVECVSVLDAGTTFTVRLPPVASYGREVTAPDAATDATMTAKELAI